MQLIPHLSATRSGSFLVAVAAACNNTGLSCVDRLQIRAAEGRGSRAATCITASKNGAVKFSVKKRTGMFMDGGRLDMWIKSNTKSSDPYASSTPRGQPPNLKIFLMNVSDTARIHLSTHTPACLLPGCLVGLLCHMLCDASSGPPDCARLAVCCGRCFTHYQGVWGGGHQVLWTRRASTRGAPASRSQYCCQYLPVQRSESFTLVWMLL